MKMIFLKQDPAAEDRQKPKQNPGIEDRLQETGTDDAHQLVIGGEGQGADHHRSGQRQCDCAAGRRSSERDGAE